MALAFNRILRGPHSYNLKAHPGVYCQWMHQRQTCLAHLIRRARGLSERQEPEIAWFGHRVLAELQRLVHWAQAPPTAGAVQT
jgi:hypothetical protein